MVTLTIDDRSVTVPEGTRILDAARSVGIDIPHYCYHPLLSVAGSCRMCLVEIEGSRKMVLACDTLAREGMVVRTNTAQVADARRGMLEFLLLNHPLDCPVCDRGGECMLHRYTMDYGPGRTRTIEPRLRFRKPQLDPLLDLERNRCIMCTRCVRFAEEIAGERVIGVFKRGEVEHIGTFEDRPIRSPFSGMIVDLCPVGAWTSKPFRFQARVWELQQVQSTCPYCAAGCHVTLWMRAGKIYRVTPPSSPEWRANFQISYDGREIICNQGRFGCDSVNRADRIAEPRSHITPRADSHWDAILDEAARRLTAVRDTHGPEAVGFLASSRATCEEMYLLQRLARDVVGTHNVDWRVGAANARAAQAWSHALGGSTGQLDLLDSYDAILIVNADLAEQIPVVALKIKEAARRHSAPVYLLDYRPDPWIARHTKGVIQCLPDKAPQVLESLAARDVAGVRPHLLRGLSALDELDDLLGRVQSGLIVYGLDLCSGLFAERMVRAAVQLQSSLGPNWHLLPVLPQRNAAGAFLVGCQPDRLPGGWSDDAEVRARVRRFWKTDHLPESAGLTAPEMIEAARTGRLKALYVLGAGDFHALPWLDSALAALENLELLIVHDAFESPLTQRAHLVLPGALFSEKEGTLADLCGMPARLSRGGERPAGVQDDAAVLDVLAQKMGRAFGYRDGEAVFEEMVRLLNPACPHRPGEYCDPGPGEEWPMRCRNVVKARAQMQWGKFHTLSPTYMPVCRWAMGGSPRPMLPAPETAPEASDPTKLKLVWSPILFGADSLGDRSVTTAPLRGPAWIEMHPFDAHRLGLAENDVVVVEGDGLSATGRLHLHPRAARGTVFAPQNWSVLRFDRPPDTVPSVIIRKA